MKDNLNKNGDPSLWREISQQDADCSLCKRPGGGAVIRCNEPDCSKEAHLDCACQQGSLALDGNGILSYKCSVHFKEILFCSCKQKYDVMKPMVFCDQCCDWFHNSCEGINAKAASELETYTCKSCKSLFSKGKELSKETVNTNIAKEQRSVDEQEAGKAIALLSEVAHDIGPMIDRLQSGDCSDLTIAEMNDVVGYLTSPPIVPAADTEPEQHVVRNLGVEELLDSWRDQVHEFLERYNVWLGRARQLREDTRGCLSRESGVLEEAQCGRVEGMVQEAQELVQELRCVPKDAKDIFLFSDCLNWVLIVLQEIHEPNKPDNWVPRVSSHFSKIPRLKAKSTAGSREPTESFTLEGFGSCFNQFAKQCHTVVQAMVTWYKEAVDLLNMIEGGEESNKSFTDLQQMVKVADAFPAKPMKYEEITLCLERARKLDDSISAVLQDPLISEEQLQKAIDLKSQLSLHLPSDSQLQLVCDHTVFLKALRELTEPPTGPADPTPDEETRVSEEVVESLVEEALQLGAGASEGDCPLLLRLRGMIKEEVEKLERGMSEARKTVQDLPSTVLSGEDSSVEALEILRKSRFIVPEEELLEFFQTCVALKQEIKCVTARTTLISTTDVTKLKEKIQSSLNNTVIDKFEAVPGRKAALRQALDSIDREITAAEAHWVPLRAMVEACDRGEAHLSFSQMQEQLVSALGTNLCDEITRAAAEELLQRAQEEEGLLRQQLPRVLDAKAATVATATTLNARTFTLPLPLDLTKAIRRRYQVCRTVRDCTEWLQKDKEGPAFVDAALEVMEKEMASLRELKGSLGRLLGVEGSLGTGEDPSAQVERALLESVDTQFSVFLWQREVCFLWKRRSDEALTEAEELLKQAHELGSVVTSLSEFEELEKQLDLVGAHMATLRDVQTRLREAKTSASAAAVPPPPGVGPETKESRQVLDAMASAWMACDNLELLFSQAQREEQGIRLLTPTLRQQLQHCLDEVQLMNTSILSLRALWAAMDDKSAVGKGLLSMEWDQTQFIDLRSLGSLTTRLQSLLSGQEAATEENPSALLRLLEEHMRDLFTRAGQWNDHAQTILPQKSMRKRNKKDPAVALNVVSQLLLEPIARAVRTPMLESISHLLTQARTFRGKVQAVLMPGQALADYEQSQLAADLNQLTHLRQDASLIPLDLPDFKIVDWMLSVLEWVQDVPYPGKNPEEDFISLEDAEKKLGSSSAITEISQEKVMILKQLGAFEKNCFVPSVHPMLRQCGALCDLLDDHTRRCQSLQARFLQLHGKARALPRQEVMGLFEEVRSLKVKPDAAIRAALEKAVRAKEGDKVWLILDPKDAKKLTGVKHPREGSPSVELSAKEAAAMNKSSASVAKTEAKKAKREQEPEYVSEKHVKAANDWSVSSEPLCAAANCGKPLLKYHPSMVLTYSSFCSDRCARLSSAELLTGMLSYRVMLCQSTTETGGTAPDVSGDKEAYQLRLTSVEEGKEEISSALRRKGYLLEEGGELPSAQEVEEAQRERTGFVAGLLYALPPAASFVFRCEEEGMSPRAQGPAPVSQEKEMRFKVSSKLEELFIQVLQKVYRGEGAGEGKAFVHGSFLAMEVEEELFQKCCKSVVQAPKAPAGVPVVMKGGNAQGSKAPVAATKKELDIKEYRKKHMMLSMNLQKPHNEYLIARLASFDLNVSELLDMTPQQFADVNTQQRRQQQLSDVVQDAHRISTEEALEARRRVAMDNQAEGWRAGRGELTLSDRPLDTIPIVTTPDTSSSLEKADNDPMMVDPATVDEEQQRMEEAVKQSRKRSIDVDAMTRFTSGGPKPFKAPRLDEPDLPFDEPVVPVSNPEPSPRQKAPNLLDMIKANQKPEPVVSTKPVKLTTLTNVEGVSKFVVIHTSKHNGLSTHINFRCSGLTDQSDIGGVMSEKVVVNGRVALTEYLRVLQEVQERKKRRVVPLLLTITGSGSTRGSSKAHLSTQEAYNHFCEEFTEKERVAICKISSTVELYLIVPPLRERLGQSPFLDPAAGENLVLYGLMAQKIDATPSTKLNSASSVPKVSPSTNAGIIKGSSVFDFPPSVMPPPVPPRFNSTPFPSASPLQPTGYSRVPLASPPMQHGATGAEMELTEELVAKMKKTAQRCVTGGTKMIDTLRSMPNARQVLPFIFQDHPFFKMFLEMLKTMVEEQKKPVSGHSNAFGGTGNNAFGGGYSGGSRESRFGPR